MSAICGGNHQNIKTREEWNKHFTDALKDHSCLDCCCGILPIFQEDKIVGWHQI